MKSKFKFLEIIVLVAVIGLIMVACSKGGGRASPVTDFNYELTKDGKGIMITGYTGNGGKVIIPSIIEDYPVTTIAYMAFRGQSQSEYFAANNITELVIPNSVVTLSSFSFYWIENLKSVTLPDGIKALPSSVFGTCFWRLH